MLELAAYLIRLRRCIRKDYIHSPCALFLKEAEQIIPCLYEGILPVIAHYAQLCPVGCCLHELKAALPKVVRWLGSRMLFSPVHCVNALLTMVVKK